MFSLGYRVSSLQLPSFSCFKGPAYAALIMSKKVHVAGAEHYIHIPFSVAQYVECPLQDQEAPGSMPGRGTPKSLIMLLVSPAWHTDFRGRARTVSIM